MSHEYKSIESLYVRNPVSHALEMGNVRVESAGIISAWSVTEKLDGMNIRAVFYLSPSYFDGSGSAPTLLLAVKGRTDAAVLPQGVQAAVERQFSAEGRERILATWSKELLAGKTVTFYGEAIGEGIQSNPLRLAGKRFRVFDILVADKVWLSDVEVQQFAQAIGFAAVPLLGLIESLPVTEKDMDVITQGTSVVATERIRPEGIVARPLLPLFDKWGNRVIWKLTYREFDKLRKIEEQRVVAEVEARTEPVQASMENIVQEMTEITGH